ncbi:hypothetical protein FW778_11780 [Ginsengibacter hankyongi]|uniref:Alpha/beta hydrolase n=1 Tax=Ginsengibacter hankyongi TaxID=2607284 RepID=A0A5J5IHE5_9BACT|nr:hypothetical protein [Ginsengibacter hankyongi]KAA9039491.1 hypothetical protein FW778_11780 [Ginsengibacter hankyongi]
MLQRILALAVLLNLYIVGEGQSNLNYFTITSSHTSFPDTGRSKGHVYNNVLYSAAEHYSDSSVIIIAPKNFHLKKKIDMIFWFHGWGNNIDSALVRYGLSRQFDESRTNAVLVLAETAKDAPDSYGGKLEQENVFKGLVGDVLQKLKNEKVITPRCNTGHVVLAGHSGAYRVMANILQNGNVPVDEVILFDALYADTDKFLKWITSGKDHRFIDLYTDSGGTFDNSKEMMRQVNDLKIPPDSLEEQDVSPEIMRENKVIFIHTSHAHNDIIQHPDNFYLFISNAPFIKKIK